MSRDVSVWQNSRCAKVQGVETGSEKTKEDPIRFTGGSIMMTAGQTGLVTGWQQRPMYLHPLPPVLLYTKMIKQPWMRPI